MRYFPILQELFESDTVFFLIIGMMIALTIGLWSNNSRRCAKGIIGGVVLYLLCELASNFHMNFMLEIILLFVGTMAMGAGIGFVLSLFRNKVRRSSHPNPDKG